MKKNTKWGFILPVLALFAMFGLGVSVIKAVGILNPVINEPALAISKRYSINLTNAAVNTITATAVYSSATIPSQSFTTGQVSTGSFLVVDNTQLTTATATNAITVLSTGGAKGDSIVVTKLNKPGAFIYLAGRDWNYGATPTATAASILVALKTNPDFATSNTGAVLYSTANSFGTNQNSIIVQTNNPVTLAVSSPTFLGGRNATTVYVNGNGFTANVNFAVGATASNTAVSLAAAINARAGLSGFVSAGTATSSVTVQSKAPGSLYNFPLASSNSGGISVLHPTMIGGSNESWSLGGKKITVANHGFSVGLQVLYSTVSAAAAISGLSNQTTYYAIPVDANTLELATSSANAVAGTAITLASSATLTTAQSYSLAPLSFVAGSNTGGFWQVSNDNVNWTNLAASSFSWVGGGGAGSTSWSLGQIAYPYLGFNVVGPNSGGLKLTLNVYGNFTP